MRETNSSGNDRPRDVHWQAERKCPNLPVFPPFHHPSFALPQEREYDLGEGGELLNWSRQGANEFCGVSGVDSGFGDVFGDDAARANDSVAADADGKNGGIGADGHVIGDAGGQPVAGCFGGVTIAEQVIDEHHTMTNEAVSSDGDKFADEGVRLDPRAGANANTALDFDEGTDEGVVVELAFVEVDGVNDGDIGAAGDVPDTGMEFAGSGHSLWFVGWGGVRSEK